LKSTTFSLKTLLVGNALVAVVALLVVLLVPTILEDFELKLIDSRFDARQSLGTAPTFSDDIVHINIDNFTKTKSGQPIWEKTLYAALIEKISSARPKAIAIDIMFVDWADQKGNDSLVEAAVNAGNLVSPFLFDESRGAAKAPEAMALDINPALEPGIAPSASGVLATPFAGLMEQSAGLGFVNLKPDADVVIRRVPLLVELDGYLAPSFFPSGARYSARLRS
jgi:adenylate cyclase